MFLIKDDVSCEFLRGIISGIYGVIYMVLLMGFRVITNKSDIIGYKGVELFYFVF